jgi:hypothetical protein
MKLFQSHQLHHTILLKMSLTLFYPFVLSKGLLYCYLWILFRKVCFLLFLSISFPAAASIKSIWIQSICTHVRLGNLIDMQVQLRNLHFRLKPVV